jgi:hypothetical protein
MKFSLWINDLCYEELCYPLSDVLEARTLLINEFNIIVLPRHNKKMYQQKMKAYVKINDDSKLHINRLTLTLVNGCDPKQIMLMKAYVVWCLSTRCLPSWCPPSTLTTNVSKALNRNIIFAR